MNGFLKNGLIVMSLVAIGLVGCGGNGNGIGVVANGSIANLEPLANGFHYEGWAIVGGNAVTFGKFNVDSAGNVVDLSGNRLSAFEVTQAMSGATKLVITIEPAGDTDTIPADTHILAGDVVNGRATLGLSDGAALGTDFSSASGSFILATPTATDPMANPRSGLWFLTMPGPAAGLSLPTLPAGWAYEGWAVIDGRPVSTGTFLSGMGADSSSTFSGPNGGPPFPGEDFLMNAPSGVTFPTDMRGKTVVISVEPSPDDSPMPFSLKPLETTVSATAEAETTITMQNKASNAAPVMTVILP